MHKFATDSNERKGKKIISGIHQTHKAMFAWQPCMSLHKFREICRRTDTYFFRSTGLAEKKGFLSPIIAHGHVATSLNFADTGSDDASLRLHHRGGTEETGGHASQVDHAA